MICLKSIEKCYLPNKTEMDEIILNRNCMRRKGKVNLVFLLFCNKLSDIIVVFKRSDMECKKRWIEIWMLKITEYFF